MCWKLPKNHPPVAATLWPQQGSPARLSPRLAAVADRIGQVPVFADIGTDHASLPIAMVWSGRAQRALACDLRAQPLALAKRQIISAGLTGKIEARLGSGLSVLEPGDVTVASACGMGGATMADMLEAASSRGLGVERLVLQPNKGVIRLRQRLAQMGWRVTHEAFVADGRHFYLILEAVRGEGEQGIRPNMRRDLLGPEGFHYPGPLLDAWIEAQLGWMEPRFEGLSKRPSPPDGELEVLGRQIACLRQALSTAG